MGGVAVRAALRRLFGGGIERWKITFRLAKPGAQRIRRRFGIREFCTVVSRALRGVFGAGEFAEVLPQKCGLVRRREVRLICRRLPTRFLRGLQGVESLIDCDHRIHECRSLRDFRQPPDPRKLSFRHGLKFPHRAIEAGVIIRRSGLPQPRLRAFAGPSGHASHITATAAGPRCFPWWQWT